MHGHSRKKSSFMYGCSNRRNPYKTREFPYILSKKSQNFNYYKLEGSLRFTVSTSNASENMGQMLRGNYSRTCLITFL